MYKLLFAGLLCCLFLLPSCFVDRDEIRGSFDGNNEHQGGPSGLVTQEDYGFNLANEFMWGINGVGSGNLAGDAKDRREWLGYDAPAPVPVNGRVLFGSTLEFVQKASKFGNATQRLNYLVLSQDVVYEYSLQKAGAVFGGLGPYIGYGIGGKTGSGNYKEASFGGTDGYKRFDAGVHLTAGYRLPNSLNFSLGYEYGLVDKSPDPSDLYVEEQDMVF